MHSRRKIVAGNWKMNFTPDEAVKFAADNKGKLVSATVDVVLCVPYVALQPVMDELGDTNINVGTQNMHYMDDGAYTGEISGTMLRAMGVKYAIIGHSERREKFGETDTTVNLRAISAIKHGITPIICVGESLKQRKANRTIEVLIKQVNIALDELTPAQVAEVIIAYEPIWAISGGDPNKPSPTPTKAEIDMAHSFIKELIAKKYGDIFIPVLYGGSANDKNVAEIFSIASVDGVLVGGASLVPQKFAVMVNQG